MEPTPRARGAKASDAESSPSAPRLAQAGEQRSVRLESLRALAALAVVVVHSYGYANHYSPAAIFGSFHGRLLTSMANGVDLFFALSGYLLFLPFARYWWSSGPRPDLGRYFRNRALRILPLYYVVIVVYLLIGHGTIGQWLNFLTFTQDFSARSLLKIDGPTWSIVAEVMFYAALPLVAWVMGRTSGRSARVAIVPLGALTLLTLVLRLSVRADSSVEWQYSPATNAFFFMPGMLLAYINCLRPERLLDRLPALLRRADLWTAAAVGVWAYHAWRFSHDEMLGLAAFLLLGASVLPLQEGVVHRVLDWRALGLVGVVSYSLYLWHDPVVHALSTIVPGGFAGLLPVSLATAVVIAAASYGVIERPFLRLRRTWDGRAAPATTSTTNTSSGAR
jgi:peptidoglycan/LPS O-acetylase OafA/YrhL